MNIKKGIKLGFQKKKEMQWLENRKNKDREKTVIKIVHEILAFKSFFNW